MGNYYKINHKLIVNADDFGCNSEVNRAIALSFKPFSSDGGGYINQTTLMVNRSKSDEAVAIARDNGFDDKVGLHLDLDNIFGESVSLYELIRTLRYTILNGKQLSKISDSIRQQMDKYLNYNLPLMHIDGHHHIHGEPQILGIVIKLALNNGFKSMRISRNLMGNDIKSRLKMISKYCLGINKKISSSFISTDYFGSYADFVNYYKYNGSLEIMVHPDIKDGKLVDNIGRGQYIDMASYKLLKY